MLFWFYAEYKLGLFISKCGPSVLTNKSYGTEHTNPNLTCYEVWDDPSRASMTLVILEAVDATGRRVFMWGRTRKCGYRSHKQ
jgi:hypothetical protein